MVCVYIYTHGIWPQCYGSFGLEGLSGTLNLVWDSVLCLTPTIRGIESKSQIRFRRPDSGTAHFGKRCVVCLEPHTAPTHMAMSKK